MTASSIPSARSSPATLLALGLILAAGTLAPACAQAPPREVPEGPPIEGFQQLLPRGGIPALVDPEFVPAAEAELPDDAWVLGFVAADGRSYAYDLNLLNRHEVVNHRAGDQPIAAVW